MLDSNMDGAVPDCNYIMSGNTDIMSFQEGKYGKISTNDVLAFYRKDGAFIEHYEERIINDVGQENSTTTVKFDAFYDIDIKIESAKAIESYGVNYVLFTFNKEHNAFAREREVKCAVYDDEQEHELCNGTIFTRNDYFVYEKLTSGKRALNGKCMLYWISPITGEFVSAEGTVPCTVDGQDMRKTLMFRNEDVEIHRLYENYSTAKCWIKDQRFFYVYSVGDTWQLYLKPNTCVRIRKGDPIFNITIDEDFSTRVLVNDGIKQFLEEESKSKINKIVDYEKQQFIPVIYRNGSYFDVDKICFYMHLRRRDEEWNIIEGSGWASSFTEVDNALGNNNFSVDDIYYQHKCVSETFLRLSFYDSVSRGTQKLLYTAKLYLDENLLWSEYVKQKEDGASSINLPFYFSCTNKYDFNNKTEGFYLHLFPGNIKELSNGAIVFLKVELCQAKYGKAVLLTQPIYPNVPSVTVFNGKTYLATVSGKQYTNMADFNHDVYIRVRLKYDANKHRYVWYLENANQENDADLLELHMFEPKMF